MINQKRSFLNICLIRPPFVKNLCFQSKQDLLLTVARGNLRCVFIAMSLFNSFCLVKWVLVISSKGYCLLPFRIWLNLFMDHWIMQFKSFHWLSHHGISVLYHVLHENRVIFWRFSCCLILVFYMLGAFLMKLLVHSCLLDMRWLLPGFPHLKSNIRSWNNC